MLGKNPHKIKSLEEKERLEEERTQQKLQMIYRKQPYSVRWRVVVPVSNVFSWTFTAYAFIIESFAIGFSIWIHYQSTVSLIIGIVLGLVLGAGIEIIKRVCNKNFWHGGIAEDDWSKGNGLGMTLALLASIGLAFMGGLNLPEATTTPPAPIIAQLENIEAIRADYENQIAKQEESIKNFDKAAPRWKGVMNRENIKQLGEMNDALTALMTAKNTAIQDAEYRNRQKEADVADENKSETSVYNEYKANTGFLFAIIALIVELLIPLPFWAKEKYYSNCALERGMTGTVNNSLPITQPTDPTQLQTPPTTPQITFVPNPNQQNVPPNQAPPVTTSPTAPITKKPIGFVFGETAENQPENEIVKNASNPLYNEFEQVFTPPVTPEKEVPEPPKHIVLKNTYTHVKSAGGGTVEMACRWCSHV